MALDLYSKGTTDTLLAAKLDLAGGTMTGGLTLSASGIIFSDSTYLTTAPAGSTLAADQLTAGVVAANPTAGPTASGDVLQYDGAALIWAPGGGGGGSYLPLAGGTMTGAIVFDGTSGQYISKGNFDTSRGGNYGISLVCSIGYEFNWQAGWLITTEQASTTPRPLYLDSAAGTTLRVWNSGTSTGTEVTHLGITFSDATTQTTAGYPNTNPDGFQTSTDVSTYVTGLGYLTDAPVDGFAYNRKDGAWEVAGSGGSVAWGAITGTVTDQTDLVTYVTGLGYQTAGDVSTYVGANYYSISNPLNFPTTSDARKQAIVESIRSVVNDAGIGFDGSGNYFIPLNPGALNNPVNNSEFSSLGKWFKITDSTAVASVASSVVVNSGVVTITFPSILAPLTGTGLFYTEDGGSTWFESTFKLA